jgi:hypothetical protein
MASLSNIFQGGFDAATVEPAKSRDFSALPAGPYDVEITNADVKDTKAGDGQYLEVEHTVISPEQYAGRKVWARLNLVNLNQKAQEIGREQLSALCHAVGIPVLKDSDHLFGKILRIRVKIDRKDPDNPRNEVTGWETHGGGTAPVNTTRPAANTSAPAPAAPAKKAPWAK